MGHAYKARFWYPFIKEHPIIRNTTLPLPPPPKKKKEKKSWAMLLEQIDFPAQAGNRGTDL